jgi:hypothetical protein
MDSKELYAVLLGVWTPRTAAVVKMDVAKRQVVVMVTHPAGSAVRNLGDILLPLQGVGRGMGASLASTHPPRCAVFRRQALAAQRA